MLLTGLGGDQCLAGGPYYYADLLRRPEICPSRALGTL